MCLKFSILKRFKYIYGCCLYGIYSLVIKEREINFKKSYKCQVVTVMSSVKIANAMGSHLGDLAGHGGQEDFLKVEC